MLKMSESSDRMAESALSPETLPPLAPALSSTPSGVNTLPGKTDHKQQQSTSGSLLARDSDDGTPHKGTLFVRFLLAVKGVLFSRIVNALLVFVPMGITVHMARMPVGIMIAMNVIAIIPLLRLVLSDTKTVGDLDDTIRATMNAAFGNAVELIILIIALAINPMLIGRMSLIFWVLVNFLFVLRMCYGRLRFGEQVCNRTVTQMNACLLALSVTNLLLPTAFHALFSSKSTADRTVAQINRGTSIVLLVVYFAYLIYQLFNAVMILDPEPVSRERVSRPTARCIDASSFDSWGSDPEGPSPSVGVPRGLRRVVKSGKRTKRNTSSAAGNVTDKNLEQRIKALEKSARDLQQRGWQEPPPQLPFLPVHLNTFAARTSDRNPLSTAPESPRPSVRRTQSEPAGLPNHHHGNQDPRTRRMVMRTPGSNNQLRRNPVPAPPASRPQTTNPPQQYLISYKSIALFLITLTFMLVFDAWPMFSWINRHFLFSMVGAAAFRTMDASVGVAASDVFPISLLTSLVVIVGEWLGEEEGLFFQLFNSFRISAVVFLFRRLVIEGRGTRWERSYSFAPYLVTTVVGLGHSLYRDLQGGGVSW
ncbi:hypothetical protein B0I37DRAFT_421339 [Chaetomium sp. MPI-CAGE-AT-0009]|nr:hypothetical protein B0I37DRAFT_421339 [Chaetomium sp. MPI-CAGE-AT-0009]